MTCYRFWEVPKWRFHSWNVRFRKVPKSRFHSWNVRSFFEIWYVFAYNMFCVSHSMFFVSHSMFSVTHNMSKRKTVPVHQLLGFSHGLILFVALWHSSLAHAVKRQSLDQHEDHLWVHGGTSCGAQDSRRNSGPLRAEVSRFAAAWLRLQLNLPVSHFPDSRFLLLWGFLPYWGSWPTTCWVKTKMMARTLVRLKLSICGFSLAAISSHGFVGLLFVVETSSTPAHNSSLHFGLPQLQLWGIPSSPWKALRPWSLEGAMCTVSTRSSRVACQRWLPNSWSPVGF